MERTKQPQNVKRRRQWVGRVHRQADDKRGGRKNTKQDRMNFARHAAGRGYLAGPRGERMKALHAKRRAAAKRAKASRKKNRK